MKKILIGVVGVLCLGLMIGLPVRAMDAEISEDQAGVISVTCSSIRIQLKNLQKADSKARVYLGSKYEFALTKLMTPLNLRLVKNNLVNSDLAISQTTFSSERDFFRATFTDYAKSLDELVAKDCQSDPYGFYEQLEVVRDKREVVRGSYLRLNDVLAEHRAAVVDLRESL